MQMKIDEIRAHGIINIYLNSFYDELENNWNYLNKNANKYGQNRSFAIDSVLFILFFIDWLLYVVHNYISESFHCTDWETTKENYLFYFRFVAA